MQIHLNSYKQECGLHYQKHYPWVIDLCLTSHIQSCCLGVWVVFGVEEISDFIIIEHLQLTRSD